jgi:YidC/Oxa1 family membrane protein insertase
VLNFIYYPVSAILWFWHKAFGYVFGPATGIAWALAVVFLVFTLRALLYKPFVHQVRSMRKMQEFQPEIKKLQAKYKNDKQKLAAEMQKLQSEHGVNPISGCLPMLVQIPVFIGLYHVLKGFNPHYAFNYIFSRADIESFNDAHLFGAKLGAALVPYGKDSVPLADFHTTVGNQLVVMIPLMIAAGFFTHLTARHNVARQTAVQIANPQTAIMNKLTLYLFPIGVVVGAPFLPLAILFYWVSNNLWTLGQQHLVYKKIDADEAAQAERKTEAQRTLAPKVGQKPDQTAKQRKPGAKPLPGAKPVAGAKPVRGAGPAAGSKASGNGSANGSASGTANGSAGDVAGEVYGGTNGTSEGRSESGGQTAGSSTGKQGRKRQR